MSSGGYQQYGGNPYGQAEAGNGGYNPYGGTGGGGGGYGTSNPYGGSQQEAPLQLPPALEHQESAYSQGSQYSQTGAPPPMQHGSAPLSRDEFLQYIDGTKSRINNLTQNISEISNIHQRMLGSPDNNASQALESIVSQTQIQNTGIKDEIKYLERDAARSPEAGFKKQQVEALKRSFKQQLQDYEKEEMAYRQRYREAIARQYKIVNPDATDAEINEATSQNWDAEGGLFQAALKSNRTGQANSVLGAVRARHNDIQRIEQTLGELAMLFQQLNEAVVFQDNQVTQAENQTAAVLDDSKNVNTQLDKANEHARRARRLKWYTLLTVVAIICILALVLGLYFGLRGGSNKKNNGQ